MEQNELQAKCFCGNRCAAGKTYETKCVASKIFLTESWCVVCPVEVVSNLLLTNHKRRILFISFIEFILKYALILGRPEDVFWPHRRKNQNMDFGQYWLGGKRYWMQCTDSHPPPTKSAKTDNWKWWVFLEAPRLTLNCVDLNPQHTGRTAFFCKPVSWLRHLQILRLEGSIGESCLFRCNLFESVTVYYM